MVQLKKRHMRDRTDTNIPFTLIAFAKAKAQADVNQKVEFKLDRGIVTVDPLFLLSASIPTLSEWFNTFMSEGEISQLENEIKEMEKLVKQAAVTLIKHGSHNFVTTTLEKVANGKMSFNELKALIEDLEKNEQ